MKNHCITIEYTYRIYLIYHWIPIESKDGDYYEYLSTILLDSILVNSNNKHYPQIFLRKCLCAVNNEVLLG